MTTPNRSQSYTPNSQIGRTIPEILRSYEVPNSPIYIERGLSAASGRLVAPMVQKHQNDRVVVLTREEDGWWVAEVPSLPGCVSQGPTKADAIANIKEAIRGYIAALEDDRLPVPKETTESVVVSV